MPRRPMRNQQGGRRVRRRVRNQPTPMPRSVPRSLSIARVNRGRDVHYFRRNFNFGDLPGNAVHAPYLAANTFSFSQLPNVIEFTSLFDRYMITHVQLKFFLTIDPSAQAAASAVYPRMWWVRDYDDSIAPGSLDSLREHAKVSTKILTPNRPVIVNIKPAVLSETYRSALATTYSPKWRTWIDCGATDCPHYGLKYGIDNFTNTNYVLRVEGIMWFACKDTR